MFLFFGAPLSTLVFDQAFLQTKKHAIWYELLFVTLIALLVGTSLKVIGGLLIGGLLVIPTLIANQWTRGFLHNVIGSVVASMIAIVIGISISFFADVPTSSAIILSLMGIFIISKGIYFLYARK